MNDQIVDSLIETEEGLFSARAAAPVMGLELPEETSLVTGAATAGDDTIVGSDGNDALSGLGGNDLLFGALGNDFLNGQTGNDTLRGGSGSDTVDGGEGDDSLFGGTGNDLLRAGLGSDTLNGGRGSDSLEGGAGDDSLLGEGGSDLLIAGRGNDTLDGGRGDDTLSGGLGDDTIFGGRGADLLDGGLGNNTYRGNGGADTFIIGTEGSFNTINAFSLEQGDQLALDSGLTQGDLSFTDTAGGTSVEVSETGDEIAFITGISADVLTENADTLFTTAAAGAISVSFDDISLPETIDFGDAGSVTLELTNTLGRSFSGPVSLDLFISTDDDQDSVSDERNDGLLRNLSVDVDLAVGESTTVEIDYENLSSVVAPGAYHLLAGVEGGELTSELVSATGSNSVLTWHATALNAIQQFGEDDPNAIGIQPTTGSRALGIVQTSVFNAVNAFDGEYESYLGLDPGDPAVGASQDAAVAGASVTALAGVFPANEAFADALVAQLENSLGLDTSQVESLLTAAGLESILGDVTPGEVLPFHATPFLAEGPDVPGGAAADVPTEILDGFLLGVNAAGQVIDARADDGYVDFFQGPDDPNGYDPAGEFEDYTWTPEIPLSPTTGEPIFGDTPYARSPGWGQIRTFSGNTVEDFLNNAGIDANGDGLNLDGRPFANAIDPVVGNFQKNLYATEIEQVRELGALESTDLTDVTRSQDQTDVAIFWSLDRQDTFRPYGHLHQIAQEAAFRQGADLAESARILGLTGIALADAGITAWNQKYVEAQPRPEDIISGDGQGTAIAEIDGLAETIADSDWQPLLLDPPFPDYLSGHSTFGGAFGGVLDALFPEATDIQVVSQDIVPGNGIFETTNDALFDIDDFNPVRTFESYAEVGAEDAVSRVFAGVHVLESTQDAAIVGADIGEFVATNLLAPVV
ncbi:MAG: hypothetical protein AAF329_09905 [Cyanobacteria bacterium P01_A01_bin.17]